MAFLDLMTLNVEVLSVESDVADSLSHLIDGVFDIVVRLEDADDGHVLPARVHDHCVPLNCHGVIYSCYYSFYCKGHLMSGNC